MLAEPQWTERVDKRGLDPLGLQNSGVTLYQTLLPGISNVTPRLRYFGYYCWVSDTYAGRVGSTDPLVWRSWIRRSEALMALVSANAGNEGGVGGIDWANEELRRSQELIDFSQAASTDAPRVYLRQAMGLFGGAYASQLLETGLFSNSREHQIAMASSRSGRALAEAFRASIGPAEPLLIKAIETATITRSSLDDLRLVAPSQVPQESDEAALYEAMLLGAPTDANARDQSRRDSLRLAMVVANNLSRRPGADDVRWHLFSPDAPVPNELADQRVVWEAYHAHDLFQVAAAGLFSWALTAMGQRQAGETFSELADVFQDALSRSERVSTSMTWRALRDQSHAGDDEIRQWSQALTRASTPSDELVELAILLIAALDSRISRRDDLAATVATRFSTAPTVRSIRSELAWIERRGDVAVGDLMASYLIERVLRRHADVAMRKMRYQRDYTFHFESRDGRLTRRLSYLPVLTSPRLGAALQVLQDLGLIDGQGATSRGVMTIRGHNESA